MKTNSKTKTIHKRKKSERQTRGKPSTYEMGVAFKVSPRPAGPHTRNNRGKNFTDDDPAIYIFLRPLLVFTNDLILLFSFFFLIFILFFFFVS